MHSLYPKSHGNFKNYPQRVKNNEVHPFLVTTALVKKSTALFKCCPSFYSFILLVLFSSAQKLLHTKPVAVLCYTCARLYSRVNSIYFSECENNWFLNV